MFKKLLSPIKNQIICVFLSIIIYSNCLPTAPNGVNFIVDYVRHSELQVPFYTVIVCGGHDRKALLSLSVAYNKLFLLRGRNHPNITQWGLHNDPQGFILDMSCPHAEEILKQANDLKLFRKPFSWLLIQEEDSKTALKISRNDEPITWISLKKLYTRIDSLVVVGRPLLTNAFEMFEVYKITETNDSIVQNLGKWTETNGIEFKSTQCLALRRRNLRGVTLFGSLVVTHSDTREHVDDLVNVHHDSPTKIAYGIYQTIAQNLNVNFEPVETGTWGDFVNGSWNGMVGHLEKKQAEVGICPLFMTKQRIDTVEYFHGTPYVNVGFIARAPPLSNSSNLLTLPFSFPVWVCSVVVLTVASILLFIANKYECEILKLVVIDKETLDGDIGHITLMNIATICQQGYDKESRGLSGRLVTIVLYLSVMFLFISYTASIVALLQSSDYSMRTVQDLIDSPLQCGAEEMPYQRQWLKSSTDPVRQELYKKKIIPKGEAQANFYKLADGIEKVRKGLYAFHVDMSAGYYLIQNTFTEAEKCGLMELKIFLQVPEPWIPIRRNSPYSEIFKISAKNGAETGVESRTTRRYYRRKPRCIAYGSNFASVGLSECYRTFLILVFGMVTAILLFVFEWISKNSYRKLLKSFECEILFYKTKRSIQGKKEPNFIAYE